MPSQNNTLITVKSLTGTRPVIESFGELSRRYAQFRRIFSKNREYRLFAEPVFPDSGDITEISWFAESDAVPVSYTDADEETRILIRRLLQKEMNSILEYAASLDPASREEISTSLRSSFEIPDESDIYLVGDQVVLVRWGFIPDAHKAEKGILQRLIRDIPEPLSSPSFQEKQQEEPRQSPPRTGKTGDSVSSPESSVTDTDATLQTAIMHFITLDQRENPVPNAALRLEYNGSVKNIQTDENAKASLPDVPKGAMVAVFASKSGRRMRHVDNFTFDGTEHENRVVLPLYPWIPLLLAGLILFLLLLLLFFLLRACTPDKAGTQASMDTSPAADQTHAPKDGTSSLPAGDSFLPGQNENQSAPEGQGKEKGGLPGQGSSDEGLPKTGTEESPLPVEDNAPVREEELKGKTGRVRVNLRWKTCADLDLYVQDPCGNRIHYSRVSTSCKKARGELDIDANFSEPFDCSNPQENVFWSSAASGSYTVWVKYHAPRNSSGKTPYVLTLFYGEETKQYTGILEAPGNITPGIEFALE